MVPVTAIPPLRLRVARKERIATDVTLFELRDPADRELPPFTPGSHITVTAPTGQKRRYSLCNAPDERDGYLIAVKAEHNGRGGSLSLVNDAAVGDELEVEPPGNAFEMSRLQPRSYLFIAGGIGITPIRAMIHHLVAEGRTNFKLFYFTRTPELMAFRDELSGPTFAGKVVLYHDNGDPDQGYDLWSVLAEPRGAHLYCCGPRGLMDAVRDMVGHWPETAVHFEDFAGALRPDVENRPLVVRLARSGDVVEVPPALSILDALRKSGRVVPSSCESGTCGTCRTRYLAGTPEHRDLVLSEKDKATDVMICVSRATSPELTLDL